MKKKKTTKVSKVKMWFGKHWRRLVVILGVLGLLVYFKNAFVVAFVNGQPIFKSTYVKELEKVAGSQALDSLLTKKLILHEARSLKIKISNEEMETEMARLEEIASQQGSSLDQLLETQGIDKKSLVEEIRLQKILEKVVTSEEVTDEEVDSYLTENAEFLPEDSSEEELRTSIREQLEQQKVSEKVQAWIQELQSKAKVVSWL